LRVVAELTGSLFRVSMLRMKSGYFTRPLVVRVVAAWLAAVLVVGLWQGYGAWLSGGSHAG
jgi:hypothetical protein